MNSTKETLKAVLKRMDAPEREIVIYVEGGVVHDVLYRDDKKPPEKWEQVNYTLIDFDIDGVEEVCNGCLYSPDAHYDACGQAKPKRRAKC